MPTLFHPNFTSFDQVSNTSVLGKRAASPGGSLSNSRAGSPAPGPGQAPKKKSRLVRTCSLEAEIGPNDDDDMAMMEQQPQASDFFPHPNLNPTFSTSANNNNNNNSHRQFASLPQRSPMSAFNKFTPHPVSMNGAAGFAGGMEVEMNGGQEMGGVDNGMMMMMMNNGVGMMDNKTPALSPYASLSNPQQSSTHLGSIDIMNPHQPQHDSAPSSSSDIRSLSVPNTTSVPNAQGNLVYDPLNGGLVFVPDNKSNDPLAPPTGGDGWGYEPSLTGDAVGAGGFCIY